MSFALSPDHTQWYLTCDRPGCTAHIPGIGKTDREQKRDARDTAERRGWQQSPFGAVPSYELCRAHVEPTLPYGPVVTRLFDEQMRAIPYKGGR